MCRNENRSESFLLLTLTLQSWRCNFSGVPCSRCRKLHLNCRPRDNSSDKRQRLELQRRLSEYNPRDAESFAIELGRELMFYAALHGNSRIMSQLIDIGVDIQTQNDEGNTSLHLASLHSHLLVVRVLLEANASILAKNKLGYTPLHYAASSADSGLVSILLAGGVDVNVVANDGSTPLHLAALFGNEAAVGELLAAKADPNATDARNRIPLDRAVDMEHKTVVQALGKAGGEMFFKDSQGN